MIIYCVNDGAVMTAWKDSMGLAGSDMIEFLADTHGELTEALGLTLTGPGKAYAQGEGPNKALGFHTKRCKRSAMYVVDGVVKAVEISEGPTPDGGEDPAGDSYPDKSMVENMLSVIKAL